VGVDDVLPSPGAKLHGPIIGICDRGQDCLRLSVHVTSEHTCWAAAATTSSCGSMPRTVESPPMRVVSWRVVAWVGITAATAGVSRWLGRAFEVRPAMRRPGSPAACEPAAARAEQRLADGAVWRWVETRLARRALRPYRVRPSLRRLRVLNLDHGPGGVACALSLAAPHDATVVAVDSLPGMAELARHRAHRRGVRPNLWFARSWPYHLPFPDGTFDLVVSAGGLHQWPYVEAALGEVRRVLRPEGRYVLADFRRDLPLPLWLLVRLVQALVVPRDLRAVDEPSASIAAAYAPPEAEWLAARARLPELQIVRRAAWLIIQRADLEAA
jgi:SAM-dependent methyltransferase